LSYLQKLQIKTLFIEPGSPWENGFCKLFNGKLRDELLNGEIFYTFKEAQILIIAVEGQIQYYPTAQLLGLQASCSGRRAVDCKLTLEGKGLKQNKATDSLS